MMDGRNRGTGRRLNGRGAARTLVDSYVGAWNPGSEPPGSCCWNAPGLFPRAKSAAVEALGSLMCNFTPGVSSQSLTCGI